MELQKNISNSVIKFFLEAIIIFLIMFTLQRIALLLLNPLQFKNIPKLILVESFIYGLRYDLSVILYPLSILFVINYLAYFFNNHVKLRNFNAIYLSFFFLVYTFLSCIEIEFFNYFHLRLNAYAANIYNNTRIVLLMIWEAYPVSMYLVSIGFFVYIAYTLFIKLQRNSKPSPVTEKTFYKFIFFIPALFLILVGINGSFNYRKPISLGEAYFSNYNSANQLALNGIFTFTNDYFDMKKINNDFGSLLSIRDTSTAVKNVESMVLDSNGRINNFPLRTYNYNGESKKYNVVIIMLESFSGYGIDKLTSQGYSLYFNKIKKEGLYFSNFYSNGYHTALGVFSTLFGMPNVLGDPIINRLEGQQEFSGIVNILKHQGYKSFFGVSHDPNFDNMTEFLRRNGTEKIISQNDFQKDEILSSLGVADHRLLEKMNSEFAASQQPFLGIVLTTNNHSPWLVPKVEGKKFNSTFDYTDWSIMHYFELAQKENYYKNTIFVILADHGKAETPIYDLDLQFTHIPCLIYNPGIIKPLEIKNICSQIDITQIIMGLLNQSYRTTNFGRNVLNMPNENTGFAFMSEEKTLGLIWNEWYLIDRLNGNTSLYKYASSEPARDYYRDMPELAAKLKLYARSYYFLGNEYILNRKACFVNWLKIQSAKK